MSLRHFYLSISKLNSVSFLTHILPCVLLKSSERHYHLLRNPCQKFWHPLRFLSLSLLPFSINHCILSTSDSQIPIISLSLSIPVVTPDSPHLFPNADSLNLLSSYPELLSTAPPSLPLKNANLSRQPSLNRKPSLLSVT